MSFLNSPMGTDIGKGMNSYFDVLLKIPVFTESKFTLTVTSSQDTLDICDVRIITSGNNVPCASTHLEPTLNIHSTGGPNNGQAVFDMGVLTNIGKQFTFLNRCI